jgi:D-xylose transport system permease protein
VSNSTISPTEDSYSIGLAFRNFLGQFKVGNLGSIPAISGFVTIAILFSILNSTFYTPLNMANLIQQMAPIVVIAMGIIFVLLLAEIDLSAGYASGVTGFVIVKLTTSANIPWWISIVVGIIAGAAMGLFIGVLVSYLRIPSFVVSLATFLGFNGILLLFVGSGTVQISDKHILSLENDNFSVLGSWLLFIIPTALYILFGLNTLRKRSKAGRHSKQATLKFAIRSILLVVVGALVTWRLTVERSPNPSSLSIKGTPFVAALLLFLLLIGTFVLNKTTYGRHIFAVGGNAEAALRAGINVRAIRTSGFVICSATTAIAGLLFASRQNSISATTGGSSTLLYAVGAAVIGGTSLFGGKGRMVDALIGGLVVQTIDNGLYLLNATDGEVFISTGLVLLLFASVDALTRRKSKDN